MFAPFFEGEKDASIGGDERAAPPTGRSEILGRQQSGSSRMLGRIAAVDFDEARSERFYHDDSMSGSGCSILMPRARRA